MAKWRPASDCTTYVYVCILMLGSVQVSCRVGISGRVGPGRVVACGPLVVGEQPVEQRQLIGVKVYAGQLGWLAGCRVVLICRSSRAALLYHRSICITYTAWPSSRLKSQLWSVLVYFNFTAIVCCDRPLVGVWVWRSGQSNAQCAFSMEIYNDLTAC